MDYKLTIELVPETAWYTNVRSNVSRSGWDKLRKECYRRADHKCEICASNGLVQGFKWPVECHEIWEYDDEMHIQKLIGLISLCPLCHKVKHPGLAGMRGESHLVIQQLMHVNKMTKYDATRYVSDSFRIFEQRSQHNWLCDISYLDNYLKGPNDWLITTD